MTPEVQAAHIVAAFIFGLVLGIVLDDVLTYLVRRMNRHHDG